MKRALLLSLLLLAVLVVACGDDETTATPIPTTDIVGVLELPISHRAMQQAPGGASLIEISPTELRYERQPVLTLAHGRIATADVQGESIARLRTAINAGTRRHAAVIRLHVLTPFATLRAVLTTLQAASVTDTYFAVRPVNATTTVGWLDLRGILLPPPGEGELVIPNAFVLPWDEFVRAWERVAAGCRTDPRSECSAKSTDPATGGTTNMVIRTRGDGIKVELSQVGGDPATAPAAPVEMIEGVPSTGGGGNLEAVEEPSREAHFTFRVSVVTASPSALSAMFTPLCASRSCGVTVTADPETPSMNVISALGASFPNGAQSPFVALRSAR